MFSYMKYCFEPIFMPGVKILIDVKIKNNKVSDKIFVSLNAFKLFSWQIGFWNWSITITIKMLNIGADNQPTRVCMYMYVCMYICMYILYTYIYIYIIIFFFLLLFFFCVYDLI